MELVTNEKQELHQNAKLCHICKEKFEDKYANKKCIKVRNHCYYAVEYRCATHSICIVYSRYSIPKEITMIFRNELNCDSIILPFYHFCIILSKNSRQKYLKENFFV